MKKRADIAVYDADYVLQLVVEIKKQPDADTQWATQMRCNLLRYEVTPNAPYFLLALSNNFYLWKNSNSVGDKALPDYIINANGVLSPYFSRSHAPAWECILSFPRAGVGMHFLVPTRRRGNAFSRSHAPAWECIFSFPRAGVNAIKLRNICWSPKL